jgi:hypothetical protein
LGLDLNPGQEKEGALNIFKKGRWMKKREKLLDEIFELALQNDMNYFG